MPQTGKWFLLFTLQEDGRSPQRLTSELSAMEMEAARKEAHEAFYHQLAACRIFDKSSTVTNPVLLYVEALPHQAG